jgi:pseudouridine synthase
MKDPEHWVDIERDKVTLDGMPVKTGRRIYLLLYKPKGYLTTARDPQQRRTIYELLGDLKEWVTPVGRLDLDTSGLLVLTNDTSFVERLTNPDHGIPKTYLVKAATRLSEEQINLLRHGVVLHDGLTRRAIVKRLRDSDKYTFLEMTITEGRNRQVRRMLEAVDSKVLKLVRTGIGPLRIADLRIGRWRELTREEVRALGGRRPNASRG